MLNFVGLGKSKQQLAPCAEVRFSCAYGELYLAANSLGLAHLRILGRDSTRDLQADSISQGINRSLASNDDVEAATQHLKQTCEQLDEYFCGQRARFSLDLAPYGTEFQHQVWQTLVAIPYGEFTSYGAIAEIIKNPKAVRAVGTANGANPIAIIVPCHRVIGKDGSLTGYAYGVSAKQQLLNLEGAMLS